jgi:hypothetical protein
MHLCQLTSAHARHHHIGDAEVNRVSMIPGLFEGKGMIKPRQQAAPTAVEDLANEEEILLLVSY